MSFPSARSFVMPDWSLLAVHQDRRSATFSAARARKFFMTGNIAGRGLACKSRMAVTSGYCYLIPASPRALGRLGPGWHGWGDVFYAYVAALPSLAQVTGH